MTNAVLEVYGSAFIKSHGRLSRRSFRARSFKTSGIGNFRFFSTKIQIVKFVWIRPFFFDSLSKDLALFVFSVPC